MKKKLLTDFNYWEQDIDTIQSNIKISQKDCHWIKDDYNSIEIKSFLDVPGWINDAQWIFKEVIENCSDGDRVVEIGTYFGQSACYMGMLIKDSGKDIKFDTYDTFEELDPSIRAGQQPKQFAEYRLQKGRHTAPMSTIVKSHFKSCGVDDYVNLIICDATYSYKFYKDNSLMLFYNDAVNNDKELYEEFQKHIDDLIYIRQRTMETANDAVIVYRQQGAIDVLRKLKLLKETVNGA